MVNKCLQNLHKDGYLNDNNLSKKANDLFDYNKPKNAIILAAGLGIRMIPVNNVYPKALIQIDNETLIERIIKQLKEVDVDDIYVVVGYMKDSFEFLMDEYDVKLIVNNAYLSKNNLYSLSLLEDKIDNTYIIPCDVYSKNNPFCKDKLYSWYMVTDKLDKISDVRVNRKHELVKINNGEYGNKMIGISYINCDTAKIIKPLINEHSKQENNSDMFWEEVLYKDNKMIVYGNVKDSKDVFEINTFEELREMNTNTDELNIDVFEVIKKQFNCEMEDIQDIQILKKRMTNRSFEFTVRNKRYVMRIPGEGADQLIDRKQEAEVYKAIAEYDFCDKPIYINPENSYKISEYIDDARSCDPFNINDLSKCMDKLKQFHNVYLQVDHVFDIFEKIDFYESLWNGQASIFRDYEHTKRNVRKLKDFVDKYKNKFQLTHIDVVSDNFIFGDKDTRIQLIDWEYAGMQDKDIDIAMFIVYSMYDKKDADRLIDIYFENKCDDITRAKIYCYIAMSGLLWSNWCEYKRNLGVEFGEYSLRQYRFAKDYYRYAVELIQKTGEII